jgi:hypothetical protein
MTRVLKENAGLLHFHGQTEIPGASRSDRSR